VLRRRPWPNAAFKLGFSEELERVELFPFYSPPAYADFSALPFFLPFIPSQSSTLSGLH